MDIFFDLLRPIGINEPTFQQMLIAALLGMSIYVTLYGGMFSLANAGFMAIGAYTSVILTQRYGWSFIPAVLGGMLMAGVIALLIGLPVLRLNDIYLAIATIGFGEIVVVVIRNFSKIADLLLVDILGLTLPENFPTTRDAQGFPSIPVITQTEHLLVFVLIFAYALYRMQHSRFGRALAAIRQDANVAASQGINVVYYKNMAFIFGAMIAGCAGGLAYHLNRVMRPEYFDFDRAVEILSYTVLGGTTTVLGPIVGGIVLEYLPELLRRLDFFTAVGDVIGQDLQQNEANIRGIINGLVLILFIVYLPGGLADPELWRGLRRRFGNLRKRLTAQES